MLLNLYLQQREMYLNSCTFLADTLENFTQMYWMNFVSFWKNIYILKVKTFKWLASKKTSLQFFLYTAVLYFK